MDNKKLLGRRIKEIRRGRGYTQEELSEMVGIEASSLSGIESGRFFPSLHILDKMSTVLDLELIEFFKFTTVDIPQDVDSEIEKIIQNQNRENKENIYKILKSMYPAV